MVWYGMALPSMLILYYSILFYTGKPPHGSRNQMQSGDQVGWCAGRQMCVGVEVVVAKAHIQERGGDRGAKMQSGDQMHSGDQVGWCAGRQLCMCVRVRTGLQVCKQAVVHVCVGVRAGWQVCRQAVVHVCGGACRLASVQAGRCTCEWGCVCRQARMQRLMHACLGSGLLGC